MCIQKVAGKMERDEKGRFTSSKIIKSGVKGFDRHMRCLAKQYKENTIFEEPLAVVCAHGMHFCENPLGALIHYPPNSSIYAGVDALTKCDQLDGKYCTTKLRINNKLTLDELCDKALQAVEEKAKNTKKQKSATSSGCDRVVVGNNAQQSKALVEYPKSAAITTEFDSFAVCKEPYSIAGCTRAGSAARVIRSYSVAAITGCASVACTDNVESIAAATNDWSAAYARSRYSTAVSGGCASIAVCNDSRSLAAVTGSCSAARATANAEQSVAVAVANKSTACCAGRESFAVSLGALGQVRGALGCFLVCAEWALDMNTWRPVGVVSAKVDGEIIKADTWYRAVNGKLVEV